MGTVFESNINKISGQVVYLASGFNNVFTTVSLSGVTSDVSGRTVWIADTSGGGIETVAIGGERYVRALISGQPITANINVAANVSGNIIYTTSGRNSVQISGQTVVIGGTVNTSVSGNEIRAQFFDPSGAVWREPWVDRSGGHKLQTTASGDVYSIGNTVTVAGTVATNISGNVVNANITNPSIPVTTSISGNLVNTSISGNLVNTSISGQTVNIAGGVTVSGSNIRIQAFDPSGNTWRDVWVERSGGNRLIVDSQLSSVASGLSLTPALSGLTMELSGAFDARISGQTVKAEISGQTVIGNFTAVVSGQPIGISGQTVIANTSGQLGRVQAFDPSGNTWRDLWVDRSGGNKLLVEATVNTTTNVSGNTVISEISGQTIIARISGQTIVIGGTVTIAGAVTTSISGNVVNMSGGAVVISGQRVRVSGEAVIVSGQTIVAELKAQDSGAGTIVNLTTSRQGGFGLLVGTEVPNRLTSYPILYASAASGGTALDSGISKRVTLRNVSQSSGAVVYVGFSGINNSPWSGRGFYLRDGDGVTLETNNPAFVRVAAVVSGQPISYFSVNEV